MTPHDVACPRCQSVAGQRCRIRGRWSPQDVHKARAELADKRTSGPVEGDLLVVSGEGKFHIAGVKPDGIIELRRPFSKKGAMTDDGRGYDWSTSVGLWGLAESPAAGR